MNSKSPFMSQSLSDYIEKAWLSEPEVLQRLREETAHLPEAGCQISADQGQLMTVLVRLLGVRKALEVGVFTGYSSICTAMGMPEDGELVACDISPEYTAIARRYWKEAGVEGRVRLILGAAVETLKGLIADGHGGTFDMAFIDADKPSYETYFDLSLELLRPNGMILVDNVFWNGQVADDDDMSEGTETIRRFNAKLAADPRIDLALIPIADGLTLARKR